MILSGYWMPYSSARKLASNLGIEILTDTELGNRRMEFPINTWLYNQKILHVKLAGLIWNFGDGVEKPGLVIVSHFRHGVRGDSSVLAQRDQDLEVKKWLEESGGVESENLQWISFVDTMSITLTGTRPKPSCVNWSDWSDVVLVSNEEHKAILLASYRAHLNPFKSPGRNANINTGSQPPE